MDFFVQREAELNAATEYCLLSIEKKYLIIVTDSSYVIQMNLYRTLT